VVISEDVEDLIRSNAENSTLLGCDAESAVHEIVFAVAHDVVDDLLVYKNNGVMLLRLIAAV